MAEYLQTDILNLRLPYIQPSYIFNKTLRHDIDLYVKLQRIWNSDLNVVIIFFYYHERFRDFTANIYRAITNPRQKKH